MAFVYLGGSGSGGWGVYPSGVGGSFWCGMSWELFWHIEVRLFCVEFPSQIWIFLGLSLFGDTSRAPKH